MPLALSVCEQPSQLLQHMRVLAVGRTYDLLVGRSHLGWVDLSAAELLLDRVKTWVDVSPSSWRGNGGAANTYPCRHNLPDQRAVEQT